MPHATHTLSREMQECIDTCSRCHRVCLTTLRHCLGLGGRHAEASHITLLTDCAEACRTSADFMIRESDFSNATCRTCAEVCRACAEDCDRIAEGDRQMQECAEVCRACADSCERMAAHT